MKHVDDTFGESKLHYGKPFVQPSFGYKTKHFEIALSSRLNTLNYYKFENVHVPNYYNSDKFRNSLLLEPAITVRGGWEKLKIQWQLSKSYNSHNGSNFFDNDSNTRISIGVVYSINIKKAAEM